MSNKEKNFGFALKVETTPEEFREIDEAEKNQAIIDNKIPKFIIKRKQKSFIDKLTTPLYELEYAFINTQEARRNSKYTIEHYKQTFRILYEFLAFTYCDTAEDIGLMYDLQEDRKEPLSYYGRLLPIVILENDDLQRDFGDYLTDVREVGEQTVLSYFRDYRAIMYYAMEEKIITPFAITVKDKEPPIKNPYTDTEIKKLLRKPNNDLFEENRNWVLINYFLATGNRIQTVINLKVKDIDFEEGFVNINVQKSGKTTRLGITKKLLKILAEYIDDYRSEEDGEPLYDEYLFCTRYGEKLTDEGIKKAIKGYNLSRGVNKTSIHLFRHTYAKLWITSGGDLVSLQKALGHSSLKMVQRYANLYATDVKEQMEKHSALNQQRITTGQGIKKRKQITRRVR